MNDLIIRLREEAFVRREAYPATADILIEVADVLERSLPAINAWTNPDALRTQIVRLTQNPYSPTDSQDSSMELLK